MQALQKAVSSLGNQKSLASAIGVAPQVVHNWLVRGNVPADKCPAIERATAGAVRCEDLRPDVDWAYVRGTSSVNPENSPESQLSDHVECCSGEPCHGERRRPEMRSAHGRREDEAA